MILYLDSSAMVKLFHAEDGTGAVRQLVAQGHPLTSHLITYAEVCAAFARLARERKDSSVYTSLRKELDDISVDWDWLSPDFAMVRRAADLAENFSLRGYDSVQLAAAEAVANTLSRPIDLTFCCFDQHLASAGAALGFRLLDAQ